MDRISDDEISLAVSGACGGIRAIFESKIGVENPLTNPAAMEKLEFIVKGYLMEILQRNGENSGGNAFEKVSFAELLDALDSKIDAIGEVVEWVRRKLDEGDEEEVVLDKEMIEPEDGIELIEDSDAEKDIGSNSPNFDGIELIEDSGPGKNVRSNSPDLKDPITGRYLCRHCPTTFLLLKSMKEHESAIHLGVKSFSCQKGCGFKTAYLTSKRRHETHCNGLGTPKHNPQASVYGEHVETERYLCSYCTKTFYSKQSAQIHEFSQHLGQKPYECRKGCGYASAHMGVRSAHENRCLGQGVPRGRRKKVENLRSGSADRKKFGRREAGGSDVQRAFNIRDIKREWPET